MVDPISRMAVLQAEAEASQAAPLLDWTPYPPPPHCPTCGLIFPRYKRAGMTAMQIKRHHKNAHEQMWYGQDA